MAKHDGTSESWVEKTVSEIKRESEHQKFNHHHQVKVTFVPKRARNSLFGMVCDHETELRIVYLFIYFYPYKKKKKLIWRVIGGGVAFYS